MRRVALTPAQVQELRRMRDMEKRSFKWLGYTFNTSVYTAMNAYHGKFKYAEAAYK